MKTKKTLMMTAIAVLMFGFTSCTKEAQKPAEKVAGTYKGYTLTSSDYFSDMFTADETVAFTMVNDNTVKIDFTSSTWGTFSFGEALVEGKEAPYKVTGSGKCQMAGMGEQAREYDCTFEATIHGNGADVMTFSLPAVMGGTTLTFKQGEAPLCYYVAGKYKGTLSYGVSEMDDVEAAVELKAQGGDKIGIVLPSVGEGMMTIPEFTLTDITISTTDKKLFAIAETEISQTVGTTNYTGFLRGEVNDGVLTLNYAMKPGAMPMSINFTFVGE